MFDMYWKKSFNNYSLVFILLFVGICISFITPVKTLINFYTDDGFFYLKIAKNFAQGYGTTFDRVNLTNGYHPLWLLILTSIYYVTSIFVNKPSPEILLRISFLTHYVFICLTYYFTYKAFKLLFKNEYSHMILMFIALSLIPLATRNYGMELHVTTFLIAIYFWIKTRELVLNEKLPYQKIIIFCLLGLTRIDFFFTLVPVLILFNSFDKKLKIFIQKTVKYSIPVLIVLLGYLIVNYVYYGHFFTISSELKDSFPNIIFFENLKRFITYFTIKKPVTAASLIFFIIVFVLIILVNYVYKKKTVKDYSAILFQIFTGFSFFILINFFFNRDLLMDWYLAGPVFMSVLTVTIFLRKQTQISHIITVLFLIITAVYIYNSRVSHSKFSTIYDYAKELKHYVPENGKILQVDYSGIVGFLSDRDVVNGDGLVNSFEYYDYVRNGKIKDYIKKYNINYYSSYTLEVDSTANIIRDDVGTAYVKMYDLEFPIDKIIYQRKQVFDYYQFDVDYEWMLVSLK